ncbi:hypothetical protein [Candidatus Williamhamiltonella defendens]|uniref:hypothetical protein n=1 Tax=Candidatus Williamhamiltonella defendens TaxID=138072 RepID=UPI001877221A|nr:hypothetical protein [Candidatus Hamiltonella defensa]
MIIPSACDAILIAPKGMRGVEKTLGDLKKMFILTFLGVVLIAKATYCLKLDSFQKNWISGLDDPYQD